MYYDAVTADATVANNAGRLRDIAANALPNVEGLPFPQWFEQQYIFDTSVTPGPKLFAYTQPTQPDTKSEAGASVILVYYATTTSGDEKALSGVVNPVYFDYTYANRLILSNGNAQEQINNGLASASPFFSGIGDPSKGEDKQRIAIDLPISSSQANVATPGGNEYVRVYFPANEESVNNTPTDFSGVVIGALSGYFQVTFNGGNGTLSGGDNGGTAVTGAGINGTGFGAFNGTDTGSAIPSGFHKATINFRPSGANTSLVFQRNTYTRKDTSSMGGVSPVFVLNTGLSQASTDALEAHVQLRPANGGSAVPAVSAVRFQSAPALQPGSRHARHKCPTHRAVPAGRRPEYGQVRPLSVPAPLSTRLQLLDQFCRRRQQCRLERGG